MPQWEVSERRLGNLAAEMPESRRPIQPEVLTQLAALIGDETTVRVMWRPPQFVGINGKRRVQIEQCLARTGSIAAAMDECEASYEVVHTLMEWMAA